MFASIRFQFVFGSSLSLASSKNFASKNRVGGGDQLMLDSRQLCSSNLLFLFGGAFGCCNIVNTYFYLDTAAKKEPALRFLVPEKHQ